MKTVNFHFTVSVLALIISLCLFPYKPLMAQTKATIGLSAGYALLNLDEVNSDLKDSYLFLLSEDHHASSPDYVKGGSFVEGYFLVPFRKISLGASVSYVAGKGYIINVNTCGLFLESYDVSTFEIMGIIGKNIPLNQTLYLALRGYAGYGTASVHHIGKLTSYVVSGPNLNVTHNVSGGYFASRIQGGLEILLERLVLSFYVAYRLADPGILKGDVLINGTGYGNRGIQNIHGENIAFDFTGITFIAGVQYQL